MWPLPPLRHPFSGTMLTCAVWNSLTAKYRGDERLANLAVTGSDFP